MMNIRTYCYFWGVALLGVVLGGSACSSVGAACETDSDCPGAQRCLSGGGGVFFSSSECFDYGEVDSGVEQDGFVDQEVGGDGGRVSVVFREVPGAISKAQREVISYRCVGEDETEQDCVYECMVEVDFLEPDEAEFETDTGKWASCGDSMTVPTSWAGEYRFHVRATAESGGKTSELSRVWKKEYVGWTSVSAGNAQTCGIDTDSQLWCWGTNFGGFGVAGLKSSREAVLVGPDKLWQSVSVGSYHACAITVSGDLWCWGSNGDQQTGVEGALNYEVPIEVVVEDTEESSGKKAWKSVSAGKRHTCGISKDVMYCWGTGTNGQLGVGDVVAPVPTMVGGDQQRNSGWTSVSVGAEHSCGGKTDGFWCWGSNAYGQIAAGVMGRKDEPWAIPHFKYQAIGGVSSSVTHTCAVSEYELYCWGRNTTGQLGLGLDTLEVLEPARPIQEEGFSQVSTGLGHTCAIKEKALWCWGRGVDGGSSGESEIFAPTLMDPEGTMDWMAVSAGVYHTCGIRSHDELWCWGANNAMQLGLDRSDKSAVREPAKVRVHLD